MGHALLLFVLLGAAQDAELDAIIDKLDDPDLDAREAAAEKLITLGTRARPLLKKLEDAADLDLRARVRHILDSMSPDYERAHEIESRERVAVAPDGSAVAWLNTKGELSVLDLATGKTRFTLRAASAYRPPRDEGDGLVEWSCSIPVWTDRGLAVDLDDADLFFVDPADGKTGQPFINKGIFSGGTDRIDAVHASGDGLSATITTNAGMYFYLSRKDKAYLQLDAREGYMSRDGRFAVALSNNGDLKTYAGEPNWKLTKVRSLKVAVRWMVPNEDLSRVRLASPKSPCLFDVAPQNLKDEKEHDLGVGNVTFLSASANGKWLLVGAHGSGECRLHVLDAGTLKSKWSCVTSGRAVFATTSARADVLAVLSEDKVLVFRRK